MKRGQFNWAHYTLRFFAVALILTFYIMTYRIHEGKNFLDTHEEKTEMEDVLFFDRLSHHCFAPFSLESGRKNFEALDLRLFTQERLKSCIPVQSRLTLTSLFTGKTSALTSSDAPSFQPDVTQKTLVLVDDSLYVLQMELQHA